MKQLILIFFLQVLVPIKISITEDKNLPNKLCKECLKKIKTMHELRNQSIRNDLMFRKMNIQTTDLIIKEEEIFDFNQPMDCQAFVNDVITEDNLNNTDSSSDDNENDPDFAPETFPVIKQPKESKRKASSFDFVYDNGLFKCPDCLLTFEIESVLSEHYRNNHPNGELITRFNGRRKSSTCNTCGLFIPHSTNLGRHVRLHHDSSLLFACSQCTYRFSTISKLRSHGERVHDVKEIAYLEEEGGVYLLECDLCGQKFIDKKSTQLHMKLSHKRFNNRAPTVEYGITVANFPCDYCDRIFTASSNLYRHIKLLHPEKHTHECTFCNEAFRTESLLFKHVDRVHGDNCDVATMRNRPPLANQPISCHFCQEDFGTSKYAYEKHLIAKHRSQLTRVLQCSECDRKYAYEDSMRNHKAWHRRRIMERDYEFECIQCSKKFPNKEKFDNHK